MQHLQVYVCIDMKYICFKVYSKYVGAAPFACSSYYDFLNDSIFLVFCYCCCFLISKNSNIFRNDTLVRLQAVRCTKKDFLLTRNAERCWDEREKNREHDNKLLWEFLKIDFFCIDFLFFLEKVNRKFKFLTEVFFFLKDPV